MEKIKIYHFPLFWVGLINLGVLMMSTLAGWEYSDGRNLILDYLWAIWGAIFLILAQAQVVEAKVELLGERYGED